MQGPMGQPEPRPFPTYVPYDLGTLGGASSCALAINERGRVVGWAETPDGARHAVLWEEGRALDLGVLPGCTRSEAWDINDDGLIVGIASTDAHGAERAFAWHDGRMDELPGLAAPKGGASASAVNNLGQIVGGSLTGSAPSIPDYHAVQWEDDRVIDLDALPEGVESHAWDLNDSGQVAGVAQTGDGVDRAVMWVASQIVELGTLDGVESIASAINAQGWVVGTARAAGGFSRAFLWRDGVLSDLGTLAGGRHSRAYDVSDRGQVVGSASTSRPDAPQRAFLWQDGLMADLNDLLGPESGWVLTCAHGLNTRGRVVGQGVIEGRHRAFLLTPTDETTRRRRRG